MNNLVLSDVCGQYLVCIKKKTAAPSYGKWNTSMQTLINQTREAANSNAYYLSLFAALAIPDICAAISSPNGEASKVKYIAWFNQYVSHKYTVGPDRTPSLSGEDCYYYRCAMLHQGRAQHERSTYTRILFIEPGISDIVLHNNVMNDALNIDIRIFCTDICDSAEQWLADVEATPDYQRNYPNSLQRYPDGLAPYIIGLPIIA